MAVLTLAVGDVRAETPRTRVVRLPLCGQAFDFRAGQAVWLRRHGAAVRKPYSIACSPEQAHDTGALELLVQITADGSAGAHLGVPVPGLTVEVDGPFGSFCFPENPREDRFLFVAGGTGIAPVRAMLQHALARFPDRHISLFYSVRAADEFAYGREMRELARSGRIELRETVTRENTPLWAGARGRFTLGHLAELLSTPASLCFICGPPALVQDVSGWLRALGVPDRRILADGAA